MKRRIAAAALLGLALTLAGCGDDGSSGATDITPNDAPPELRVGHFDFAESPLLAELYGQALQAAGVPVRQVEAAGPREVLAPALEQGEIDLLPEYLGTASGYFGGGDVDTTIGLFRSNLEARGLTALEPSQAQNTNVFVVLAEAGLGPSISDLSDVASTLRFGGPTECPDRPLCIGGVEATYGFQFAEFVAQPTLEVTGEALRRNEIEVGLMYSTDAAVTDEFLVLADDKSLQPPENVVPVIRVDALERWGDSTIRDALDGVSLALDTESLRDLNRRVAAGESHVEVAADWLASVGLGAAS
jgi:osmoprotectant transport system substrate-binding protein